MKNTLKPARWAKASRMIILRRVVKHAALNALHPRPVHVASDKLMALMPISVER